jgi:hypothetical protein
VFYKGEVILLVEKRTRLFVVPQAGVATHVCRIGPNDAGHLSFLCLQVRTYIYVGTYVKVKVPRLPERTSKVNFLMEMTTNRSGN